MISADNLKATVSNLPDSPGVYRYYNEEGILIYVGKAKSLKKRVLDYFKQDFWADTAVFTAEPATRAGMEFFPLEKIVFASDCPFDPEGGTMYPRETLRILESLDLSPTDRDRIFFRNLEAVTGRKLARS